jgi:acetyl-CoA carboxylase alpha subunit
MVGDLTWSVEFPEAGPADLVVRTSGVATVAGLGEWTRAAIADERRTPGMRVLIDHRELDWTDFRRADVFARSEGVRGYLADADVSAIAVVLGSSLGYGLQRMMQAHTGEAAERAGVRFGAFRTIDEAEQWLEAGR